MDSITVGLVAACTWAAYRMLSVLHLGEVLVVGGIAVALIALRLAS